MSQEHENAKSTDNLTSEGQEALSALRGIWKAQGQTSADLDETCGNNKTARTWSRLASRVWPKTSE